MATGQNGNGRFSFIGSGTVDQVRKFEGKNGMADLYMIDIAGIGATFRVRTNSGELASKCGVGKSVQVSGHFSQFKGLFNFELDAVQPLA
jgi:hypothetical protein